MPNLSVGDGQSARGPSPCGRSSVLSVSPVPSRLDNLKQRLFFDKPLRVARGVGMVYPHHPTDRPAVHEERGFSRLDVCGVEYASYPVLVTVPIANLVGFG